jgi:hypothetical protein
MIDTKRLRLYAGFVKEPGKLNEEDVEMLSDLLLDAADELDAARNENLVRYRCAVASAILAVPSPPECDPTSTAAKAIEMMAHAMLDAERKPSG